MQCLDISRDCEGHNVMDKLIIEVRMELSYSYKMIYKSKSTVQDK